VVRPKVVTTRFGMKVKKSWVEKGRPRCKNEMSQPGSRVLTSRYKSKVKLYHKLKVELSCPRPKL